MGVWLSKRILPLNNSTALLKSPAYQAGLGFTRI